MYDRKIVPVFGEGYRSLRRNGEGYHKFGKSLPGERELLHHVQSLKSEVNFDLSEIPDDKLRKKLDEIVKGTKTVTDKDWRAKFK